MPSNLEGTASDNKSVYSTKVFQEKLSSQKELTLMI